MIEFSSSHRMSDFKYRSTVSHWKGWGFSLSSLQAIPPPEYDGIWTGGYSRSLGTPYFSLTHFLSLSGRRELIIDGKEVNEPIIKHSRIPYGSVIEFEMCDMP